MDGTADRGVVRGGAPHVIALAVLMLLSGPAWAEPPPCPFPGQAPTLIVRLFFGQSIKGRGLVSHRAWQRFVTDTLAPALPDGFTVYDAHGQFVGKAGALSREPTEVVETAAADTAEFRQRIAAVVDAYRQRFNQDSVGVVSSAGCAAF